MATRMTREMETRERNTRDEQYVPPGALPDVIPEEGWAYRWVATYVMSQADNANVSKKMREGWEPVKAIEQPQMFVDGNASGNIEIGGLMLCKAPLEKMKKRADYYDRIAQGQIMSVDNNFMREQDPRMQLFIDRKTKVTFGKGNSE
ncbi:MAG TPA: hypothetical protein PLQ34_07875 [Ferrovaceae bacterium]|nr:hypothetical protein [Ferrovaceae bacterium]